MATADPEGLQARRRITSGSPNVVRPTECIGFAVWRKEKWTGWVVKTKHSLYFEHKNITLTNMTDGHSHTTTTKR